MSAIRRQGLVKSATACSRCDNLIIVGSPHFSVKFYLLFLLIIPKIPAIKQLAWDKALIVKFETKNSKP